MTAGSSPSSGFPSRREAKEKLEKGAAEHHLALVPPERDTSTALLAAATAALQGKTGRAFDSTWANLAYNWLSTLILDNNRTVSAQAAGAGLGETAREHSTWLFRQLGETDKLRKKFK